MVSRAADDFKKIGSSIFLETPEQSISQQLKVVDELQPSDSGLPLAHTGGEFQL